MENDNPTILFIDDEPNVLDALRRKLREYDKHWTMIFSHSGVEALEIIGKRAVFIKWIIDILDGANALKNKDNKKVNPDKKYLFRAILVALL